MRVTVIRSQRADSEMEFIHTARELHIYSVRKCAKFPKRYTFLVGQPTAYDAIEVHKCVKMGNKNPPTNAREVQKRREYFLEANARLDSLVSQIEVAHELFGLEPDVMKEWMGLIEKEMRLLSAVLEKDRERYKNIK